jgi:hypothetical protein
MKRVYWLPVLALALATTASAQTIVVRPNDRPLMPGAAEQVRVSVGVNLFVPLSDNSDQALKAQEDSRRAIYNLAEHECGILNDVLASDCHLESVNVNVNVQRGQAFGQQKDGLNINGNISFRIVPK